MVKASKKRQVKREYKDRLFKLLFGNPEYKKFTLALYNAVNGTDYTNEEDIEITTLEDFVYMRMKNDLSFLFLDTMSMYEHQSTINPNITFRFLEYASSVYHKYLVERYGDDKVKYSSKPIVLPPADCVVFYNGKEDVPDVTILQLSDLYPEGSKTGSIQVTARMYNVNEGRNRQLLEACKPLQNFSWLVARIRKNWETMDLKEAIERAIDDMPEDFVIREIVMKYRSYISDIIFTEFNEQEHDKNVFEDGREVGIKQGIKQGIQQGTQNGKVLILADWISNGGITYQEALSKYPEITAEELDQALKNKSENNN